MGGTGPDMFEAGQAQCRHLTASFEAWAEYQSVFLNPDKAWWCLGPEAQPSSWTPPDHTKQDNLALPHSSRLEHRKALSEMKNHVNKVQTNFCMKAHTCFCTHPGVRPFKTQVQLHDILKSKTAKAHNVHWCCPLPKYRRFFPTRFIYKCRRKNAACLRARFVS